MKDRREIRAPSARAGASVELPALETSKIELYRAMLANHVNKSELARRLDWHLPQVDRVLDVRHGSQIDQMEAAFAALGKKLVVNVVDTTAIVAAAARRERRPRVHGGVLVAARQHKRAAKKR